MNQSVLQNKKEIVNEVVDGINNSSAMIIAEYRGLTVKEMSELKRSLLEKDAKVAVYKNRLVNRAAEQLGHSDLASLLEGPNAFITSKDPIAGAKVAVKFAKSHENLVIKGALVEGKVITKEEVVQLSKLPGREGLISMLLSVLQAPVRGLAVSLKAVAEKQ
jgi:large subunit ribosomal protein L10